MQICTRMPPEDSLKKMVDIYPMAAETRFRGIEAAVEGSFYNIGYLWQFFCLGTSVSSGGSPTMLVDLRYGSSTVLWRREEGARSKEEAK